MVFGNRAAAKSISINGHYVVNGKIVAVAEEIKVLNPLPAIIKKVTQH
jgi:hypothetical protein